MTAEIIPLNCQTTLDLPPKKVLQGALDANLQSVLIIGLDEDANPYYASSLGHPGENLWMIERFKIFLLSDK